MTIYTASIYEKKTDNSDIIIITPWWMGLFKQYIKIERPWVRKSVTFEAESTEDALKKSSLFTRTGKDDTYFENVLVTNHQLIKG